MKGRVKEKSRLNSYPNFSNARVKNAQFPSFLVLSFAFYGRGDLQILRSSALLKLKHFGYFSRKNLESVISSLQQRGYT